MNNLDRKELIKKVRAKEDRLKAIVIDLERRLSGMKSEYTDVSLRRQNLEGGLV